MAMQNSTINVSKMVADRKTLLFSPKDEKLSALSTGISLLDLRLICVTRAMTRSKIHTF